MTEDAYQSRAKLATRLAFVAAGFGVACWAPLVPFAKSRCHLGDDTLGLVLLLLGAGSIVAMPLAANLSARFSSKPIGTFGRCRTGGHIAALEHRLVADRTWSCAVRLRGFSGIARCCNELARCRC